MSICDLHNYKDAYKIYKILLHKNHSNLIIYGKLEKKVFIKTILDEYFQNKETINIYDEEIYYEYNSYYYYFNIKKIKLDTKDSFIKTIKKISKSYNYFTDKNNYIILDNYDKINPIIENKLKVIIEKTLSTTKFIILTRMFDKVLQANQSRCICIRISLLSSIDKEIYIKNYLKINNIQKEDRIIKELINSYSDINDIIKKIDGYNDPMKIFLQKIVSFMDNKLESKGKLVFKAPNLVKWEYTIPYHNIAIFKDDKLYVNNDGDKEVFNLKSNKLFKNLNSLIINCIKGSMFDDRQFSITYFKLDDCFLVKFIPNEKKTKRFIARFELKFSNISAQVEEIKLVEPNGDFTTIIFNNKLLNTEISDESFKY